MKVSHAAQIMVVCIKTLGWLTDGAFNLDLFQFRRDCTNHARRYLILYIENVDQLEPCGIVEVTGAPLKGTVIQGKEVPQLIDELPILAVAGALASGTTIIRHAQELRVKETDRIAAIAHNLRIMGAQVIEMKDGLEIHGPAPLHGARVASFGDHRIAMAFAVAGLFADGETVVQDAACIRESYPGFEVALEEFIDRKSVV